MDFLYVFIKSGIKSDEEAKIAKGMLEDACNHYYLLDKKIMSDNDYDLLNEVYEKYTGEIVSGVKGTTSMSHGYDDMMNTLKKSKNLEEFYEWLVATIKEVYGRTFKFDKHTISLAISNKMDGNSILIEYVDGWAQKAVTRGKDGLGVDVTEIFRGRSLKKKYTCGVKYEAMVANSRMDAVSKFRGKELVDSRSAISGILGRDNGYMYNQFIDLFPIDVSFKGRSDNRESVIELIDTLHDNSNNCGFQVIHGNVQQIMSQISAIYTKNTEERITWDYCADGLVIEFIDEDVVHKLGWHKGTSVYPKYARALKYPAYEMNCEALRIEFDIGPTGRITPCVVFTPVVINGRTYQRTSIANYKRFNEMKIGKGTKLLFSLSHDVLGYLDTLDVPENKGIKPFSFIEECPECGGDLFVTANDVFVYCDNGECPALIAGQLLTWVKKLGLKGIADSTLRKLVDEEIIKDIPNLYNFDINKAYKIAGLGKVSIDNFVKIINSKLVVNDYEALAVACPEGIGRTTLKPVCKSISLYDMITQAKKNSNPLISALTQIEGIQEINAKKIVIGLKSNLIDWAVNNDYITIKETYSDKKEASNPMGKKVCVTGKLHLGTRDSFVTMLEKAGHTFHDDVKKDTEILVTNDPNSGSSKNKKAVKNDIPIWSEEECVKNLSLK
jgi:DNA ligase (NAD+)